MKLDHINLENLKTTALNVRKIGAKDIADLEPSIRSLGLLQPLLVRPNCEGFEVIAGQRRFYALTKIAQDTKLDPIPCIVMAEGDDATAIEASLAENIARLPMDEIDQYKAFAALLKQGQSSEDIASRFGISERLVKQRLAIANLLPQVLSAYRKDEIQAQTLRILTMATKKQQKAWLELFNSDDDYAPQGHALKKWLFGGAHIPTSNALFDLEAYKGNVVSNLFGEESYFDNPDTFWTAQNEAIADTKARYLAEGWSEVVVLGVGEYFPSYDYVDTDKERGGKVYVSIAHDGEVTCYEGQLSRKDIKAQDKAESAEPSPQKPELTKPMQNYLDLHRHAAVRAELLAHQGTALRLAVAQIIAGSDLWSVHAEPQRAANEAIADSLEGNAAQAHFAEERLAILGLLDMSQEEESLALTKGDWKSSRDIHAIFAKLLTLSDEDVSRILTFVVAETLPSGSALVDILGQKHGVDASKDWSADQCFFDLMRDKPAINAMVQDIGGKAVAKANLTATGKLQKQIVQDYLSGKRKGCVEGWTPRYFSFPMQGYTERGGINAIENWNAVKTHFAA